MKNDDARAVRTADLQEVRRQIERMIAEGRVDEALDSLFTIIASMQKEIGGLSLRVRSLLKQMYGRRSEKVDPNQLKLFVDAVCGGQGTAPVENEPESEKKPEPEPEPEPRQTLPRPKTKSRPHGRKPLPANLPRQTEVIEPAKEDRICATCGQEKAEIGRETSELLEWIPGHIVVQVIQRVKVACPSCEGGVVLAPVADKVIERGRPGAGLLAHLLVSKYPRPSAVEPAGGDVQAPRGGPLDLDLVGLSWGRGRIH